MAPAKQREFADLLTGLGALLHEHADEQYAQPVAPLDSPDRAAPANDSP